MTIEPSSDLRQMAHALREMYVALLSVGFTQAEAMQIMGTAIAASITAGGGQQ